MGIGDWGLGIGDWAQSPIPNPQSPQSPFFIYKNNQSKNLNFNIIYFIQSKNFIFKKNVRKTIRTKEFSYSNTKFSIRYFIRSSFGESRSSFSVSL